MWLLIKRIFQLVIISIASMGVAIVITLSIKKMFEFHNTERNEPQICTLTGSNEIPYEVLIVLNGQYVCSGTLIDKKHVLTLAQCVFDSFKEKTYKTKMKVVVGTRSFPGGTSYEVEKITCHPSYDPLSFKDNIAVLQITRDESEFDYLSPISLPDGRETFSKGLELYVSSFIRRPNNSYAKHDQHFFRMQVVNKERCQKFYSSIMHPLHLSGKFCATAASGYSPCRGVFGGPAAGKGYYLIGIYTNHKNCALKYPELFIDVSAYLDFIKTAMV